jgi:hypothetical protein
MTAALSPRGQNHERTFRRVFWTVLIGLVVIAIATSARAQIQVTSDSCSRHPMPLQQANYVFEPPSLVGTKLYEYGYAVAFVPGYPFVLISEHYQDVGSTSEAGQVYVYQMN